MPVPEIDRLAHEILDILGRKFPRRQRPKDSWSLLNCAFIAITGSRGEIYSGGKPLSRSDAERLQSVHLRLQQLPAVGDNPAGEFQRRPVTALFGLSAALERAEMQERATTTTHLDANEVATLPLAGGTDDDMTGHQEDS